MPMPSGSKSTRAYMGREWMPPSCLAFMERRRRNAREERSGYPFAFVGQ